MYAFNACTSLKCVFIPTSVELIDSYAFNGCTSLNYVYYCGTERQWSDILIRSNNNLTYCYYYSETKPSQEGDYWHYAEDGVTPVIW